MKNSKITIINNLNEIENVSFDELSHGEVFVAYGSSAENSGVGGVPMMKFTDYAIFDDDENVTEKGNPIAICLDDGDWFYYEEVKRWACRRVNVTLTLDSFV